MVGVNCCVVISMSVCRLNSKIKLEVDPEVTFNAYSTDAKELVTFMPIALPEHTIVTFLMDTLNIV